MPITSSSPNVVAAREQISFAQWWLWSFTKNPGGPGEAVSIDTTLLNYTITPTLLLNEDQKVSMTIDPFNPTTDEDKAVGAVLDQFTAIRSASPNQFIAVVELVSQCVGAIAKTRGAIPQ